MRTAIINLGTIVSGDFGEPLRAGDTIITDGDRITASAPHRPARSKRATW